MNQSSRIAGRQAGATALTSKVSGVETPVEASQDSRGRGLVILVLVLAAVLFFARLGARALWSSEFRWGEVAREMILNHSYFWPTINGRVYYDKPLGSYWLVVASTWISGGMNETAARLPSAIAGLLSVGSLIMLGCRLYDRRTGVLAGFILTTSFSFVFFSRHASADVETIAGELAALTLFLRKDDRAGGWWVVGFWLIMALTSLMKGLLGFALPLLVVGIYSCLARGWPDVRDHLTGTPVAARLRWLVDRNGWFFNRYTLLGSSVAAIIYFAPFTISDVKTGSTRGLYMVYRENIERFFQPFDHRGPIYLYAYVIFALMAPWSVFLPAALAQAHYRRTDSTRSPSDRFVLTFFWATFIFFTTSGSRRSYYILPILPAAALLVARLLREPLDALNAWSLRLVKLAYGLIALAVLLSAVAFFPPRWFLPLPYALLPMAPNQPVLIVCWIGSIIALAYGLLRFGPKRIMISTGTFAYLFLIYVFVVAMPSADRWRGEKPFANRVRQIIDGRTADLTFFGNSELSFYLELPRAVPEYRSRSELNDAVRQGRVHWLVTRRRDLDYLPAPFHVAASETTYLWNTNERNRNAMVLVQVEWPRR